MDNGHPNGRNPALSQPVPVMASRAGVLVDPMPLSGQTLSLGTDISQDLLEQRGTQEQAKLLERFKMLRQWQQQQQNQLMLQQQQQLELLRNQQEMVQQALMQQRLKQWGGGKVSNSPSRSPSHKHSPKKSPTSSPARGTMPQSSVPNTLSHAALIMPLAQNGHSHTMENPDPAMTRYRSSSLQEDADADSENEHPSSLSLEGVYPLPDTASEASDAGTDDHHDDQSEGRDGDDGKNDEMFRSESELSMTPTDSARDMHHLSIHLPNSGRTEEESSPPLSTDRYPSSLDHPPSSPAISPQLSPFTPTTPSRLGVSRGTRGEGGGEVDRGESELEDRPIQSQLGVEFRSFEELVELQIKSDDRTLPAASSAPSEKMTGKPCHAFLKRGEGISRFGMKARKFKARKEKPAEPAPSSVEARKLSLKNVGSRAGSKMDSLGGKLKENSGKKKQPKKDEPPKISRKVSSKQPKPQSEVQAPEHLFKKPHPAPAHHSRTKPGMSPVEREKVGVAVQHRIMVPSKDPQYGSQSEHDDSMEVSFSRHAKVWEKKTKSW